MTQHFNFDANGKVYGCSFRRANYSGIYFGRITEWRSRKDYDSPNFDSVITEAYDIALEAETKEAAHELATHFWSNRNREKYG